MSVVDASLAVDALVGRDAPFDTALAAMAGRVQVPAIFPAEVTSALRRMVQLAEIDEEVAASARQRLATVRMRLHPFLPYADRIWELRANLTVYDAWYVAVAERMAQPLVTADAAILKAPGIRCELIDSRG